MVRDVSQLKQLYSGVMLYAQDSDDLLPESLPFANAYLHSTTIFQSPVDPYRNGVPGFSDFPADLVPGSKRRSMFRVSYSYLVPVAANIGLDSKWVQTARSTPSLGLIANFMYNEPKDLRQPFSQFDLWRWQSVIHRVNVDGSYHRVADAQGGITDECALDPCFTRDSGP